METLKLKAQTLYIAADFENNLLRGATALSVSLILPGCYGQLFQSPFQGEPPLSSGFVVPLRCPSSKTCSITSIEVNGVPSLFSHHDAPLSSTGSFSSISSGAYDLLSFDVARHETLRASFAFEGLSIDLPPVALHRASLRSVKPKHHSGLSQNGKTGESRDAVAITLKITVSFTLFNLTPATSVAFFTSHCVRRPTDLRLIEYPLFITRPDATQSRVWFPTTPACWAGQSGEQKRSSWGRCTWHCHFTVPCGMVAVGTGFLYRRSVELATAERPYACETFSFETRGSLSALPASEICLFVGRFTCWSGDKQLMKTMSETLPNKASLQDVDSVKDENDKAELDGKKQEVTALASDDMQEELLLTCITLKDLVPSLYFHSIPEVVSQALAALHATYGVRYPHPQLFLLFLPIGLEVIQLGEGIWESHVSTLTQSIPHPGHQTTSWVFGGTVVFDISLVHTATENHSVVFRAKETIAEGVLSVLFGSVWSASPGDMAKDWWLLTAFRRLVIDQFIERCFGAPHQAAMQWLRMELYAKLVETGYDFVPLSISHLDRQCSPTPEGFNALRNDGQLHTGSDGSTSLQYSPSWFNPRNTVLGLKSGFILPSLDVLLSSPSSLNPPRASINEFDPTSTRWSPPVGTLTSFLSATVARAYKRGPGVLITTKRFLERLERRLKAVFIASGVWQCVRNDNATSSFSYLPPPEGLHPAPPTVDTLDLSLYVNNPNLNIAQVLSMVSGFFDSWVFGVGCSSSSLGLFLQLQKKTATSAIESCRLRFDETPLQPPSFLDPYTGVSDFHPALLASKAILEILLEESCELEGQQQHQLISRIPVDQDYRSIFANHDLPSLFQECGLELLCFPFGASPYELIVKDYGTGLGFGYTGRDVSPITDGCGTLYQLIEARLSTDWAMLEPDQRVLLTADTASRAALLSSQIQARSFPLASPPLYPQWLIPVAAAIILRDVVRFTTYLRYCPGLRSGSLQRRLLIDGAAHADPFNNSLKSFNVATDLTQNSVNGNVAAASPEPFLTKRSVLPCLATPLSFGFGKYYTDLITVHVCGDRGILHDPRFIFAEELPVSFELRACDDVGMLARFPKSGQHHQLARGINAGSILPASFGSRNGCQRKFCGILSSADEGLLASDPTALPSSSVMSSAVTVMPNPAAAHSTRKQQFARQEAAGANRLARKDRAKHLPVLWIRVMEQIRPLWLARHFRCQSLGMWEQQFLNDPLTTAQLEAATALGRLPFSPTVVPCLGRGLRNHGAHPLVRSFSALALQRLHNDESCSFTPNCLSALLNYVCTYHYRSRSFRDCADNTGTQDRTSEQVISEPSGYPETPQADNSPEHFAAMSDGDAEDASAAPVTSPYASCEAKHLGANVAHGMSTQLLPKNPPFWMTSEMLFLKDFLTAIACLRAKSGKTVYEAIYALTQLLMHHTTKIASREQFNADYYIAHLISTLRHIRSNFTECQVAVEDVARPRLFKLLVALGGPEAAALEEAQRAWVHWRDEEMDSDAESLFLHVWRYYRLDNCLHSRHHVVTCACLEVFSRNAMFRDLVRLKLCDETGLDFQLLAFLPLNFFPVLRLCESWLEQPDSDMQLQHLTWAPYQNVSAGILSRHQLRIVTAWESKYFKTLDIDDNQLTSDSLTPAALCKLMTAGLREIVMQMRDQYCNYHDIQVERAALKALLYCTAVGSLEPPLLLITRNAPVALCNVKTLDELYALLEWTCTTYYPSSTIHAQAMQYVTDLWKLGSRKFSSFSKEPFKTLFDSTAESHHETLSECSSHLTLEGHYSKLPASFADLETISRFLFCSRWTSPEEMDGLQRSGVSLFNAVMLACRLDEVFTTPDSLPLLAAVWEIFHEVLGDLLIDAPLVFSAYCMKPCRTLDDTADAYYFSDKQASFHQMQPIFPPLSVATPRDVVAYTNPNSSRVTGQYPATEKVASAQRKKKRRRANMPRPQNVEMSHEFPSGAHCEINRSSFSEWFANFSQSPEPTASRTSAPTSLCAISSTPAKANKKRLATACRAEAEASAVFSQPIAPFATEIRSLETGTTEDADNNLSQNVVPQTSVQKTSENGIMDCSVYSTKIFDSSLDASFALEESFTRDESFTPQEPLTLQEPLTHSDVEEDTLTPHAARHNDKSFCFNGDFTFGKSPPENQPKDVSELTFFLDGELSGNESPSNPNNFDVVDYCDALLISDSSELFPKDSAPADHEFQVDDIFEADNEPDTLQDQPLLETPLRRDAADPLLRKDNVQVDYNGCSSSAPEAVTFSLPNVRYPCSRPFEFPTPVLCAKALWEYAHHRASHFPGFTEQRLTGLYLVYSFLFGLGLPQCLAFIDDSLQTPDPLLVDTFNANLKHGRYLKKLCLFQKRYLEDDSPEVPDWQTLAMEIVELLISLPLAAPFLDEVNHDEAPNYSIVVKEPMWLRLIQQKLQAQTYTSYHDWKNDLFLIFRNCRTFNAPESKIVHDCEALQTIVYSVMRPTEKLLSRSNHAPSAVPTAN